MPKSIIIAHHLVFTGYGHWLPNDPRGSGSSEIRNENLDGLGDIHFGRKKIQPPRSELRDFYRRADSELAHETLWYDAPMRETIAFGFENVMKERGYTIWACAVLRNHAHLLVRKHRDDYRVIWSAFAEGAKEMAHAAMGVRRDHPLWSDRPYDIFLYTPDEVWSRIEYIRKNPMKEGLPEQHWGFVKPYDNWPLHKKSGGVPRPRKR